jgi:hypothetical protein
LSAEPGSEREGEVLFEEVVGEMGAGVGASVCGVDENEGAGLLRVCGDTREKGESEE